MPVVEQMNQSMSACHVHSSLARDQKICPDRACDPPCAQHVDQQSCWSIPGDPDHPVKECSDRSPDDHELRGDGDASHPIRRQQRGPEVPRCCQRGSEVLPMVHSQVLSVQKPEHREFNHYLNMYVERMELELNLSDPSSPQVKSKNPPKAKTGPGLGNPSGAPSMIDLDLSRKRLGIKSVPRAWWQKIAMLNARTWSRRPCRRSWISFRYGPKWRRIQALHDWSSHDSNAAAMSERIATCQWKPTSQHCLWTGSEYWKLLQRSAGKKWFCLVNIMVFLMLLETCSWVLFGDILFRWEPINSTMPPTRTPCHEIHSERWRSRNLGGSPKTVSCDLQVPTLTYLGISPV